MKTFNNGNQTPAYGNEATEVSLLIRALKEIESCGADESSKMRGIASAALEQNIKLFCRPYMPNSEQNVQVSDTTGDDSSTKAG